MKTYLYYATEENCFETEKRETTDVINDVKGILDDSYVQSDVAHNVTDSLVRRVNNDGVAVSELEDGQGYKIIIGVARHGKCSEVSKLIADVRREQIAMFY